MDFEIPQTPEDLRAQIALLDEVIGEKRQDSRIKEESIALMQDFRLFIRAAWREHEPWSTLMENWHIDAITEHLQAISTNKLRRLQIWVPPGSMKSRLVSVLWPAWEWTHSPQLRYWTASFDIGLSRELTMYSRNLMMTPWWQERWGHNFKWLKTGDDLLINDQGGLRLSTSPQSGGTGKHGDRLMFDDPLNPGKINYMSKADIQSTNDWYSTVTATRGQRGNAEIIIMQRLHEDDMAAHALKFGDWEILCLPERYEKAHPYAWRKDPRKEGELLWPQKRNEAEHEMTVARLGKRHAASQLQQMPSAREGTVIPREDWRYYPTDFLDAAENGDVTKLPQFRSIVISWDTSVKDLNHSDYVAGGVWGVHGANRYLLKTFHRRASMSATKTAMVELRKWALDRWPNIPVRTLIEKASNGVEIIKQLKREIPGVIEVVASTNKVTRAEAAEPDFNSHNVWVPGHAKADMSDYDPGSTPIWVQDVIEECSSFPTGANDDLVDMTTLALNYVRTKRATPARTASALKTAARDRRRPHLMYQRR